MMNIRNILVLCILFLIVVSADNYRGSRKISTCQQLRGLVREKVIKQRIKLVSDIDCHNEPFTPLKILFTKFDGNGHTIRNLNLRYSGRKKNIHQIGLFNSLASGSVVRNLTIENVSVRGIRNVGVIAGNSHMAVVEHVTITSTTPRGNSIIGRSNKVGAVVGYAKDSTFSFITVRNTVVKGINKVGGVSGLFTGGQMFNVANLGFRNRTINIVQGTRSVGGIVGESSASNYVKVGVRRGLIVGEYSVGGIAGRAFDTEKADQIYVLRYVTLVHRPESGSQFGGFFGSYLIEGDKRYVVSNGYTRAVIIGMEQSGGFVGHMSLPETPDAHVFFRNLIMDSPVKIGPNTGRLIGLLEYNSLAQNFGMINVYYFNRTDELDQVGTINDAPSHSSYAEPQDPHYTGKKNYNYAGLNATGFTDYVDIVEMAIQNFDQERIWCQDRLRGEQGFDAKHQICRCGPYSQDYNGKCLCSSFTELSNNPSFCINSTRICTTPWNYGKKFVSAYDNLFMEIKADNVFFVENGTRRGHLEVHLSYTAQATAWTDIVVLGNNRTVIASLSKYLLGENLKTGEVWTQSLDKTGAECVQRSSFSLPWNEIAHLAQVEPLSGNFLFKVYAHTNLLRQENRVILRDLEPHGESAELITAVPILISLNTSVTTTSQRSPSFNLDFSINGTYYVKESEVNPTGTQLRVVISHTVSNPLSFVVGITSVTFDGNATTATVDGSVPVNCGTGFNLDNQTEVCVQETTLLIDLPTGFDCSDRVVNLNVVFNASCEGPNKLENSTVCASVYDQVNASQATSVPASISFNVNFCPHIEDTTITTKSFSIRQKHRNIPSGGEIKSNHVLNGTITLDVLQTVVDTRFESATIQSVFLYEKIPSNETINFLDVTLDCLTERGFEIRQDEIQISFSYIPNIYMLTKLLKNWYTGLYFVVVIDVHYLPKDLVSGKNSPLKSQVRLQIPTTEEQGVATTERAKSSSSFFTIKQVSSAKRSDVKTDVKDFTMEKAKSVSEQYNKETKKNEVLFIVLGSCIAVTMFIIIITLVIVAYNKFKTQAAPSPVQN